MSDEEKSCISLAPDDIHLGECLYRLNVSLIHHDQFHQVSQSYKSSQGNMRPGNQSHEEIFEFDHFMAME